jgi:hypothetical protein
MVVFLKTQFPLNHEKVNSDEGIFRIFYCMAGNYSLKLSKTWEGEKKIND